MNTDEVRIARLAMQGLIGPRRHDPAGVVRESLCVQAQDTPLYLDSIARRSGSTAAEVRAALSEGAIVRTHALRPTWQVIAAEDLRWVQALTGPRVLASLAGRHRQLELDESNTARGLEVITASLHGSSGLTHRELGAVLREAGVLHPGPLHSAQLAYLLMIAELTALVCSGPPGSGTPGEHTYCLVEERLPPADERTADQARAELVMRFFASHGPVTLPDLQRWTRLTLAQIRAAILDLGKAVASTTVQGIELWFGVRAMEERGPGSAGWPATVDQAHGVFLLSAFDEAILTHKAFQFPRLAGSAGEVPYPFTETGGGLVLAGLHDIGFWKRSHTARSFSLRIQLTPALPGEVVDQVRLAAEEFVTRNASDLPASLQSDAPA